MISFGNLDGNDGAFRIFYIQNHEVQSPTSSSPPLRLAAPNLIRQTKTRSSIKELDEVLSSKKHHASVVIKTKSPQKDRSGTHSVSFQKPNGACV